MKKLLKQYHLQNIYAGVKVETTSPEGCVYPNPTN